MHDLRLPRLPVMLAAGVAAALAGAAPAVATEGPAGGPPPPSGLTPVAIPPVQTRTGAAKRPVIRRARFVSRRIRSGRRAALRLTLSAPGRVRVVMTRMSRPRRGRVATVRVAAAGRRLVVRLPARAHGRALAAGRYQVTVLVTDAQGLRSRTVRRSFVVRPAGR